MRWILSCLLIGLCFTVSSPAQITNPETEVFEYDTDNPAIGAWFGEVTTSEGSTIFAMLIVEQDEYTEKSAKITALAAGLLDTPCTEIESTESDFAFTLPAPGRTYRLKGTITDDGQQYTGQATRPDDKEAETQTFTFQRTIRPNNLPEPLAFSGELDVQVVQMPMTIVLAQTPAGNWVGHLDVPLQKLREFPFINIKQSDDGTITAELPVPGSATIEVQIDDLNKQMTGKFLQQGMEIEINFTRDENYSYRDFQRPQNPVKPYPYEEREITAPHPDGFSLGGTLTIPNPEEFGQGPFPTAVLISGSGQQDRNESLLGHQPFLVIADYLTRHGIAVMRYDDRGVAASHVDDMSLVTQATSADFATDTLAVVNHIKTIPEIDADHIGLIGHSEGGLIAPLVGQLTDDIDFMVLLAGPGVPGRDLLLVQAELLLRAAGVEEDNILAQAELRKQLFQAFLDDEDEEKGTELLRELIIMQTGFDESSDSMTEEEIETALASASQNMFNPWMDFFLKHDPRPTLKITTCPVLALNGTLDLQVWHEQNLDEIERVMKEAGGDITAIRYKNMNHLFQPATIGSIAEYLTIEITIDEQVLSDMTEWIIKKTGT